MSCHSFSCKWCQTSLVEKHGYICLCLAYCLGLQDLTVSKQNMFIYDTFPHLSIFTTIFNLKGVAYFQSGSFEQPKLIKKKKERKTEVLQETNKVFILSGPLFPSLACCHLDKLRYTKGAKVLVSGSR